MEKVKFSYTVIKIEIVVQILRDPQNVLLNKKSNPMLYISVLNFKNEFSFHRCSREGWEVAPSAEVDELPRGPLSPSQGLHQRQHLRGHHPGKTA